MKKSHCGLNESMNFNPVGRLAKHGVRNISPSPVRIFITNAIRIEVMPECPPELFRVLIQGLKDHA